MTPPLESSPRFRLLVLCLLYLAQGLPFGFVTGTLAGYLADKGYGLKEVAEITFVAQFPWTFKFIWGPIIDRFSFPQLRMGRRRLWILFAQSMMVTTLFFMLFLPDLSTGMTTLIWLVALHNVFASLQDVSVDAMAVDLLPENERGKANGFMRAANYFGTFIGGTVMGIITHRHGLDAALLLQVVIMIGIMFAPLLLRERKHDRLLPRLGRTNTTPEEVPPPPDNSTIQLFKNLRRAFSLRSTILGAVLAVVILGATTCLSSVRKVLVLQDLGWTLEEYSKWVLGSEYLFALAGSITGGFLADRFSAKKVAGIAAVVLGTVWIAFSQSHDFWPNREFIVGFVFFEQFSIGVMTVSLFAIFMGLSWPAIAGTQFTAYMALLNVSLTSGTKIASTLGDSLSFPLVYLVAGIAQIAFIGILVWIDPQETRRKLGDISSKQADCDAGFDSDGNRS
ncbi:MAG: MFS transporter [Verrucomicrobiota bacterium]